MGKDESVPENRGGSGAAAATAPKSNAVSGSKVIKLVLTGDTSVGKSCLITNFLHNTFTEDYEPTVLDVYKGVKNVDDVQMEIEIHDTSGDEHLGVNRQTTYKNADVFMICVAANNPDSLKNVQKWKAEIMETCPEKPILLVLTKSDLEEAIDDEDSKVTFAQIRTAQKAHQLIGSSKTSSKEWNDFNVHKAFNKALTAAYKAKY